MNYRQISLPTLNELKRINSISPEIIRKLKDFDDFWGIQVN